MTPLLGCLGPMPIAESCDWPPQRGGISLDLAPATCQSTRQPEACPPPSQADVIQTGWGPPTYPNTAMLSGSASLHVASFFSILSC